MHACDDNFVQVCSMIIGIECTGRHFIITYVAKDYSPIPDIPVSWLSKLVISVSNWYGIEH